MNTYGRTIDSTLNVVKKANQELKNYSKLVSVATGSELNSDQEDKVSLESFDN
jgi:hypothetical protein